MRDTRRAVGREASTSLPGSPPTPADGSSAGRPSEPYSGGPPAAGKRSAVRRVNSFSRSEAIVQHISEISCASDVIRLSGYPLELHTVTTADGYVLRMERIPRHKAKDVVFFMHGVLDTSMTWVSGGELRGGSVRI